MNGHRSGSRVSQIHAAYVAQGEAAARALGASLGLAPATLNTQINRFKRLGEAPASSTPVPQSRGINRVYEVSNPARHGTVVKRGDCVSEVRWDDGHTQVHVSNEYLKEV